MIRLGFCLDLSEPENIEYVQEIYQSFRKSIELTGESLPTNDHQYRRLDCAVFEYAYKVIEESEEISVLDTARGIYVPKDGSNRVWKGSWISRNTHIQLCVRNPASLLGARLHQPVGLGVNDVQEALQATVVNFERADPQGEGAAPNDDAPGAN